MTYTRLAGNLVDLNKVLGVVALIAGGIVLSLTANGGQIITCGKWSGCTPHTDAPQNFADIAMFFFAGGIGLIALAIFLLVRNPETPKHSFDREHYRF